MTEPRKRKGARPHGDDARAASRLLVEATLRVTDIVHAMHRRIASGPNVLGLPLEAPARVLTGLVYGSVRGVTQAVGAVVDAALASLAPVLGASAPSAERAAVLAALNGLVGDYLSETGSALATTMCLCHDGDTLDLEASALREALPDASSRVVVLVHGSSMNDLQWRRAGHDHGAALARDLGYSALYLRYNSGLHVSTNGRAFAALLEQLFAAWPVPLTELVLVGHSMGGLVVRSACHAGEVAAHKWRADALTKLVCLGSPHHGAPLERGGNWVDVLLGVSGYSAPLARLGRLRSAGVTDLRYGNVRDEDWNGRDRFALAGDPRTVLPLPTDVQCYAVAATTSQATATRLAGDGLVPIDSALGRPSLAFPETNQFIAYGAGHLDLLSRPEVYEQLRTWLSSGED